MTGTLEIYINGKKIVAEDGIIPLQLTFRNEIGESIGHSFVTVGQLKELMGVKSKEKLKWGKNEIVLADVRRL